MSIKTLVPQLPKNENFSLPSSTPNPFDENTVDFLQSLSLQFLSNLKSRSFPELVALGYWLRRANVSILKQDFKKYTPGCAVRLGKGLVFHIAPSNVDTIFVYSLVISLLSGNKNVVRISTKNSDQILLLIELINICLENPSYLKIRDALRVIQYDHSEELNSYFSDNCDLRIIWGGDNSIRSIRNSPLRPHAVDITFTNKFSLAIVDVDGWAALPADKKDDQAKKFCTDVTTFNQNACSSPRMVVWLGGNTQERSTSKNDFWNRVRLHWKHDETVQAADFSNRLLYMQSHMIEHGSSLAGAVEDDIYRLSITHATRADNIEFSGSGVFLELEIDNLNELTTIIDRKVQTISVAGFGNRELKQVFSELLPLGIDRIVPFGRALDFHPIWDGYNLWESFSRLVSFAQIDDA